MTLIGFAREKSVSSYVGDGVRRCTGSTRIGSFGSPLSAAQPGLIADIEAFPQQTL